MYVNISHVWFLNYGLSGNAPVLTPPVQAQLLLAPWGQGQGKQGTANQISFLFSQGTYRRPRTAESQANHMSVHWTDTAGSVKPLTTPLPILHTYIHMI